MSIRVCTSGHLTGFRHCSQCGAAEKDYQIWLERVDSSGKVGIVLEDGSVVADNQEAPDA